MSSKRFLQLRQLAMDGDENAQADLFREFPNSFIWDNNGTYWARVTVRSKGDKPHENWKVRVAKSLETKDREEARRKRDEMVRGIAG